MPTTRDNLWVTVLVALALAVGTALAQGQDANWDLLNYHLYTPLAWMDGRLDLDIAAAQKQTWHNPVLDIPLALLVRAGASGWLVTLWLALPAAVALFFALRLLDTLWPQQRSLLRTLLATVVAAFGAAAWAATGSSFNDGYVGAGVLAALWWAVASQGRRGDWATWLPVGLLAGAVAGLKLTAAIYCIGFIAAAIVAGPVRTLPARVAALATGGIVAALLTWGPWAWLLWERHGNPLFPYFNQWFQSPDALAVSYEDERFQSNNLREAIQVPLRLLRISRDFSEAKLADPRLLLGLIALVSGTVLRFRRGGDAGPATVVIAPRSTHSLVLAFVLVSYVVWLAMYGIYRYLYPLELVLSVTIIGVLSSVLSGRWRQIAMILVAIVIIDQTKRPLWGHQDFRTPMVSVRFPQLPDDSLVVISSWEPVGHAVAFLPRDVPAISMHNNFMDPQHCTRLQAAVEARIASHAGPLFLLKHAAPDPRSARISDYGLSIEGDCLSVEDNLMPMTLCRLTRAPVSPVCPAPPTGR